MYFLGGAKGGRLKKRQQQKEKRRDNEDNVYVETRTRFRLSRGEF